MEIGWRGRTAWPELTRLLGAPTDIDSNGRVVNVLTPGVNDLEFVNGFTWTDDLSTPQDRSSAVFR